MTIRDLKSTGGTFVNGERLTDARMLRPGDQVRFANVVTLFEPAEPESATAVMSAPTVALPATSEAVSSASSEQIPVPVQRCPPNTQPSVAFVAPKATIFPGQTVTLTGGCDPQHWHVTGSSAPRRSANAAPWNLPRAACTRSAAALGRPLPFLS